ncbi:hypothetical protein OIO90_004238 [Microbotryomycetes sp. JL221]|nr:hypothetical protein OIO90_004238 [Microbotryomycetes sp. JL221]
MLRTTLGAVRRSIATASTKSLKTQQLAPRQACAAVTHRFNLFSTATISRSQDKAPEPKPTESEADVRADQGLASSSTPQATMSAEEASTSELAQNVVNPVESAAEKEDFPPPLPTESEAGVRADNTSIDPVQEQSNTAVSAEEANMRERTVFVGGLSFSVDNEWLKDEILQALERDDGIDYARVARNPMGKSKGFAFVQLSTPELAKQLIDLSPAIDGRPTDFKVSQTSATARRERTPRRRDQQQTLKTPRTEPLNLPSETIWLGNVSWTVDESDVHNLMSRFGEIVRVSCPRDKETNRFKGMAYVQYKDLDAAQNAVAEAYNGDGLALNGRPLVVDFSKSPSRATYGRNNRNNDSGQQGHRFDE